MDAARDTLLLVPPAEVAAIWPRIEPYIQAANNYGGGKFLPHDWLAKVLIGAADLFVSPTLESAAIGECFAYPRRRVYGLVLLGGEGGHNWHAYQEAIESAARHHRCDAVEIFGRGGWRGILKREGYALAHYVWRKEL